MTKITSVILANAGSCEVDSMTKKNIQLNDSHLIKD